MSRAKVSGTFFSDEDCEAVERNHSTVAAWGFLRQRPDKIGVHVIDVLVVEEAPLRSEHPLLVRACVLAPKDADADKQLVGDGFGC